MLGLKIKVVSDEPAVPPRSPHQQSRGWISLAEPVGRYLLAHWRRLSVHIIGDDEISFEEESVQVGQERCWSKLGLKDTWP